MNKTIYTDNKKNEIRLSEIKKIESDTKFSGIGIKYVVSGQEIYYANNKKFAVKQGEYIIGNDFTSSSVIIDHESPVIGICIDISSQIITEVADFHDMHGTELREFLLTDQFFVNKYRAKNTSLGYSLSEINQKILDGTINNFQQNELFYSLAESIINDQRFVFNHLGKMDFKNIITNEEILRSLLLAKDFIDENFCNDISLETISIEAGISKYHFIRLFKQAFGISPYQYLKRKKLSQSKIELLSGKSISEVVYQLGFADTPTFNKAFKQEFGITPGKLAK